MSSSCRVIVIEGIQILVVDQWMDSCITSRHGHRFWKSVVGSNDYKQLLSCGCMSCTDCFEIKLIIITYLVEKW